MLGVMTKYWRPGRVKTRLAATIGDQNAADLHRIFLHHLCVRLSTTGHRRELAMTPWADQALVAQQIDQWGLADRWPIADQGDGDLGQRMLRWFGRALIDHPIAILIGADCPLVDAEAIATAGQSLVDADVVLGPAADGGYYLVGMSAGTAAKLDRDLSGRESLFSDVPWSTDRVLAITLDRCRAAGLRVAMLPQREDIDTIDELNRLRQALVDDARHASLRESIESIL